jgi:predicted ATPase
MLTPYGQRRKIFDVLLTLLIGHAVQHPLLFILEDVHWADPSTLEWLTLLIDQTPNAAILTILTCHPMLQLPWRGHASLTQVTLTRLSSHHVEAMIQYVTERQPLPTEVVQHVIAKADGIPLFVEELTKAMLESRALQDVNGHYTLTGPLHTLAIPATLHDALMARLDRLGTAKRVAQWAATLGRQFSYALLQAVSRIDASQLRQELGRLVEADLLQQCDVGTQATYQFKHALIQEAAYQALLRRTRQQYHQQIADILDTQFPETVAVHPELLAHHYTAAGLPEQAIPYLLQAGERAVARSANVEATTHLTTGLELLKTLPETPTRTEREVAFHNILGLSLIAVKGAASPEVAQLYARARTLCQPLGDTPQHFRTLMGAYACALLRGELQGAHELAQQCLALAQRLCNPNLCLRSHQALGKALYFLGELDAARMHLEQAIALYSSLDRPEQRHFQTTHTLVMSLCFAAWALWQCGYPEQAVQRSDRALHISHELRYPYGLADTLVFTARLHRFAVRSTSSRRVPQRSSRWRRNMAFRSNWPREESCTAGHSSNGGVQMRGWHRCGRG